MEVAYISADADARHGLSRHPEIRVEEETMSNVKITDLKETAEVTLAQAANVKGGAAYIKFDGIDGESKDDKHKGDISLTALRPKS